MHAHIIYNNYLTPDGKEMSIGGIQTYLTNLIPILERCGYGVTIYQQASKGFHRTLGSFDVYGVEEHSKDVQKVGRALLNAAWGHINMQDDLLLYGSDVCITRSAPCKTIAIQHGIFWDIPVAGRLSKMRYLKSYIGKCLNAWKTVRRIGKVSNLVCVDNNFINWHRAVTPYPKVKHIFIPNFTAIPSAMPAKHHEGINIIFARRLFTYRGTRLFTLVVKRLLKEHCGINLTIAGTGPDESFMRRELGAFQNVRFTTFSSEESLHIHEDMDIAVVPTVGSEGTSLSLLEAMASGCAVVCTNVGGMTNIVLDGYNGLMVNPDEDELREALTSLIVDFAFREKLQARAFETAKEAFSLEKWQQKWEKVLHSL